MRTFACPTTPPPATRERDGQVHHPIIGCGGTFDALPDDEGLVDCPHCGIWFPASEPGVEVCATFTNQRWWMPR